MNQACFAKLCSYIIPNAPNNVQSNDAFNFQERVGEKEVGEQN